MDTSQSPLGPWCRASDHWTDLALVAAHLVVAATLLTRLDHEFRMLEGAKGEIYVTMLTTLASLSLSRFARRSSSGAGAALRALAGGAALGWLTGFLGGLLVGLHHYVDFGEWLKTMGVLLVFSAPFGMPLGLLNGVAACVPLTLTVRNRRYVDGSASGLLAAGAAAEVVAVAAAAARERTDWVCAATLFAAGAGAIALAVGFRTLVRNRRLARLLAAGTLPMLRVVPLARDLPLLPLLRPGDERPTHLVLAGNDSASPYRAATDWQPVARTRLR